MNNVSYSLYHVFIGHLNKRTAVSLVFSFVNLISTRLTVKMKNKETMLSFVSNDGTFKFTSIAKLTKGCVMGGMKRGKGGGGNNKNRLNCHWKRKLYCQSVF